MFIRQRFPNMANAFRFFPTIGLYQEYNKKTLKIIGTNTTYIKYIFKAYPYSVYYVFILIHKYWNQIFESYPK